MYSCHVPRAWRLAVSALLALAPAALAADAILIDHQCTDLGQVPTYWIQLAKSQFRLSYGHTSHGSQIVSGMDVIKNPPGSLYWWDKSGTLGGLSLHDYEPSGDLGGGGDTSWADRTRQLLGWPYSSDRNLILWSWCGGVSYTDAAGIDQYLAAMNQLELDYPQVRFIYMTGHLDGTGLDGNLNQRNNQIRAYCQTHGKVLFDFADLESYDPDGLWVLPLGANDNCDYWLGGQKHNWAIEWCAAHPGECSTCSCAHSQSLNCDRKGRAFWWLLARLAGWLGPEPPFAGDVNCDGKIDAFDIDAFVLALTDAVAYQLTYPGCDILRADCNQDGQVDAFDIDPFVALLVGGPPGP